MCVNLSSFTALMPGNFLNISKINIIFVQRTNVFLKFCTAGNSSNSFPLVVSYIDGRITFVKVDPMKLFVHMIYPHLS